MLNIFVKHSAKLCSDSCHFNMGYSVFITNICLFDYFPKKSNIMELMLFLNFQMGVPSGGAVHEQG